MRAFLLSYNNYIIITNLQQSRFLAMVGNYERLSELSEEAANAEDAALIQYLKTMDSIDAKLNQLKTTFQEFYTSTGVEDLIKGTIDAITNIIGRLNDMPKLFGNLPVVAISVIAKIVSGIKAAGNAIGPQAVKWFTDIKNKTTPIGLELGKEFGERVAEGIRSERDTIEQAINDTLQEKKSGENSKKPENNNLTLEEDKNFFGRLRKKAGLIDIIGTAFSAIGMMIPKELGAGIIDDAGMALTGFGQSISGLAKIITGNPLMVISGLIEAISGLLSISDGIYESVEDRIDRLEEESKKLNNEAILKKNEYTTLKNSIDKINELKEVQFDSAEAMEKYKEAMNSLAEANPELITGFDEMGNAIIDVTNAESVLTKARQASYEATIKAANKEIELRKTEVDKGKENISASFSVAKNWAEEVEVVTQEAIEDARSNIEFFDPDEVIKPLIEDGILSKEELDKAYSWDIENGGLSISEDSPLGAALGNYYRLTHSVPEVASEENQLLSKISDIQNKSESGQVVSIEEYSTVVEEIGTFLETTDSALIKNYNFLQGIIDSWNYSDGREVQISENLLKTSQKRLISAVLGKNFEEDFFSTSEELFSLLQNQLYENFYSSGETDFESYFNNNLASINDTVIEYSNFWNNLGDKQENFNKLLSNYADYTLEDYETALQSFGIDSESSLYSQLVNKAKQSSESYINRYEGNLEKFGLVDDFGYLSEEIAYGLLDKVSSQIEQAEKTSSIENLGKLYNSIIENDLGPEAEKIVANADLFSLSGYMDLLEKLEQAGIDTAKIPSIEEWFTNIPINLEAELNLFGQEMSGKIKDLGDTLDNVTSGMSLEEASKFAQTMGISLADLTQKDGKFFYNNLVSIKDHYLEEYNNLKEQITAEKDRQISDIQKFSNAINYTANQGKGQINWTGMSEETKNLYSLYFEEWSKLGIGKPSFSSYIEDQLVNAHNENVDLLDEYSNSMLVRALLSISAFKEALAIIFPKAKESDLDTYLNAIQAGDVSSLSVDIQNKISPYINTINESVENSIEETWDLIASAFESKNGIISAKNKVQREELIELSQLKNEDGTSLGLIKQIGGTDSSNFQVNLNKTNEEITTALISGWNNNSEMLNEKAQQIFSAKNNTNGSVSSKKQAFLDIIENSNKIEEDLIYELANKLGITFIKLKEYLSYNEQEGYYTASAKNIQKMQEAFDIEVTAEIEDALASYFNNILSIASSGISGSASNTDILSLKNYLNEQGADIELKTFETQEGMKLTEESAYAVYDALSKINSIAAHGLLENISEEMEAREGHGIDISTIYGKIGEARKKIAELEKNPDDSRLKLAKAELSTLQEIAKEKSKDEANFDFMNNDIGDLNNPLTFYDSSAKAFETLGEAASTGYMDIQSYVNMINFAANMYANAGQNFEILGMDAAQAIEAGMSAIESVDGEAKINLSGLTFGVDELTEGMEFGIEEMARSQIEWIDAQIALLKGIESIQNIGDLDAPTARLKVSDFIDNYIGNFTDETKYQGFQDALEALQQNATDWADFCAQWKEILDKNDPATLEQDMTALFSKFEIDLSDYIISESEYDLVYDKVAEIFDPKNLYDKVVTQDNAEATAEALAKSLGLDKNKLLAGLRQAIAESGGSITGEELINLIVQNSEISQDALGNLTATIEFNAKAGEKISRKDLVDGDRDYTIPETKKDRVTRLYGVGKKTETEKAFVNTEQLNIEAKNAKLSQSTQQEKIADSDVITETTETINGEFTPAIGSIGKIVTKVAPVFDNVKNVFTRVGKAASNISANKFQGFTSAVNNFNSGTLKLTILRSIVEQLNKLPTSQRYISVGVTMASGNKKPPIQKPSQYKPPTGVKPPRVPNQNVPTTSAKGNVALATGTLMGELGPELVVAGGRYYVVGQTGAEFVNLPTDAIVFNHLQTKRLLENGHVNSTGNPTTNERNAVAWATGNVDGGPAMASASDVIAELMQLRAFWAGILDMSAQDFAKAGGGGKGGGGGGGEDNKAYIADLERWYNLLRQIANLEQKITLEQAKRENMVSGYDYVDSLEEELDYLKRQQKAYSDLANLQKAYYDTRRQDLLKSDYSKIFTYTSDGLMQYHEGQGVGFDVLAKLQETDANGQMLMDATQQLAYLQSIGFDTSVLKVTKEGEDVESETEMVQNFFDNVQAWMDELDSLYDSYNDALISVEEAITAQNEIEQQYVDNQLSLEQQVLTAIIDREQAAIDMAQEEIDAMQEAADNFISGLNDTLRREQEMYQTNNEQAETERLQRQLAILQRSGGSASEIRALQEQLDSRYQDEYFDAMQDEIDAIETASKNQIEKMQEQVDIATEALEYQKANGLLWNEVYEIMNNWNANAITNFVMEFTKAFQEQSALQNKEQAEQTLKESEIYKGTPGRQQQTEMWESYYKQASSIYGQNVTTNGYSAAKKAYDAAYQATQGTASQKHTAGAIAANAEFGKVKNELAQLTSKPSGDNGGSSTVVSYPYGKVSTLEGEYRPGTNREGVLAIKYALQKLGYYKGKLENNKYYGSDGIVDAVKAFQRANGLDADGIVGEKTKRAFKLKGYNLGGLVDYTGLAMVHGTPQKPESYLNAEQTQQLSKILNEAKSLNNVSNMINQSGRLHQQWNNELSGQIYSSGVGGSDMIFEDVDINISSGVINNQAEAAQLGRTMWSELVNVARKTGNLTLSRR